MTARERLRWKTCGYTSCKTMEGLLTEVFFIICKNMAFVVGEYLCLFRIYGY